MEQTSSTLFHDSDSDEETMAPQPAGKTRGLLNREPSPHPPTKQASASKGVFDKMKTDLDIMV